MSNRLSLVRRAANCIVLFSLERARIDEDAWALGIAAEVDSIASDWEALWFALGGLRALSGLGGKIALARFGLAALILGWAGAKLYLVVLISGQDRLATTVPDSLAMLSLMAGAAYLAAGFALGVRRYGFMAMGLGCALLINACVYGLALSMATPPDLWLMALAGEDYMIWTGCVAAIGLMAWLGRDRREAAV